MKKVYLVGLIAVIGVSAYFYHFNRQSTIPAVDVLSGTGSQTNASDELDQTTLMPRDDFPHDISALTQQASQKQQEENMLGENLEKAAAVRSEIDELILELDDNLSDLAKREELKQRINSKMAEYNQYVLPVAVNSMQSQK